MPALQKARLRHAVHYASILLEIDRMFLEGGDAVQRALANLDLEWSNIIAGQAYVAANSETNKFANELCTEYANAGRRVLDFRLHPRERVAWLTAALHAAKRTQRQEAISAHLGNMGLAYADLGDFKQALACHEQALAIERERGDKRGIGMQLGNIGLAHTACWAISKKPSCIMNSTWPSRGNLAITAVKAWPWAILVWRTQLAENIAKPPSFMSNV